MRAFRVREKAADLVALDDALCALAKSDERKARIIELRYFGWLSLAETAAALGLAILMIGYEMRLARAWLRRKLFGAEHPLVASSLNDLAATLLEQGDFKGAETLFREALNMNRKLLGEEHPDVAVSLAMLAYVLKSRGEYDKAEQLLRQELALLHKQFGEGYAQMAMYLASVVRNAMKDFHCRHLSDEQRRDHA
jgi:tetratricopeptide (TPR) repeat protein